ncbi:MAG: helix-hairpin-helix domain-containing protein [Rikenellaceae bacterium]
MIFILVRRGIELHRESMAKDNSRDVIIQSDTLKPFQFDPNTVELKELISMGLSRYEAVGIIRFRAAGKVYRIKEDLYSCYTVSDSLYFVLEPYISIAEEYRFKPKAKTQEYSSYKKSSLREAAIPPLQVERFCMDTVTAKYMVAIGALTPRQAAVFEQWRDLSGIYTVEEFARCYTVSDSLARALEPYIIFSKPRSTKATKKLVDINKADSSELRSVFGIGEKSVVAIMNYREKLGGFYKIEQLSELNVITEQNFERIIKQISCDSCDISKIDVNFASAKRVVEHPYLSRKSARRLLKYRQLKGGWSTLEEIIEDNILTKEEAVRLRPYLEFRVQNSQ